MAIKTRFTKLDAHGAKLPKSAKDWSAVLVNATGDIWLLENPGDKNQADAEKWAKGLRALGKKGWRLATIREWVNGPVDYSRVGPAADLTYFRGFESGWYRTSTPDATSPSDCAWLVYLRDGVVLRLNQSSLSYVRAVLAGQP